MIIGITGNIGAGKTTVAKIFEEFGAEIIDADRLGWECLKKGSREYKEIIKNFGKSFLHPDGSIDRKNLAKIVFSTSKNRESLNRIVHPWIVKEIKKRIKRSKGVVVIDAALLLDWDIGIDRIIVVTAPERIKIERLRKEGYTKKEALLRLRSQRDEKELIKRADYVIRNSGSIKELKDKCRRVFNSIENLHKF